MPVVLGFLAAAFWGAADFLGGWASKRALAASVVVVSGGSGLVLALLLVALDPADPSRRDLLLGLGAGVVGTTGVILLFAGLAVARMGLVAPVSALVAAVLPVGWGVARGERPSALAISGIVLAIMAVVLITREPARAEGDVPLDDTAARKGLLYGALAGIGFGFIFIFFAEVDASSGMWPLVSARAVTVPLLALGLAITGRTVVPRGGGTFKAAVGSGVLDLTANAFFVVAAQEGLTSVVSPVASLYPAGTVLLAGIVLGERLQRHQLAGVGLALVGLVLLGAG